MKKPVPFGKYLLIDRVNVGGMAEVYKAKASGVAGFERLVAIKRILPNIAEDDEFITMFIDEAKISVQLQHANIAQIYDLGKIVESYFIAMEYISGKDVRAIFDRMRRRGEILPIPMTCYIVGRLCEGLDYAHRKKDAAGRDLFIVHRDISPQNVIVSFEGEVKVIDFGIAKAANKASRTQAGILKGKFGYMSPEQVRGLPLDRRSDVFAVGVCLYELLTGERLFVGESDFSTLEKVRNVDVVPPSTYNRRIDETLEGIVMKALAKDVDDRYQWCTELQESLQRYLITSDSIFSRQDLSSFMKSAFAEDLEREKVRNQAALTASLGTDLDEDVELDFDGGPPPSGTDRTEVFDPSAVASLPAIGGTDPAAGLQGGGTDPGAPPPGGGGGAPGMAPAPTTQPGAPTGPPPPPQAAYPVAPPPTAPPPAAVAPPGAYPTTDEGTQPGVSPAPMPESPAALHHGSTQPRAPMPQRPGPVPGSTPLGADSIGGVPPAPGVSPALRPISVPPDLRTVAEGRRPISEVRRNNAPTMAPAGKKTGSRGIALALAFVGVLGLGGGVAWWMTRSAAAVKTGSLIIRGTPRRAAVYLNDAPTGTIPFIDSRRAVGIYTIRVEHEGYEAFTTTSTVEAGQTATVDVTLAKAGGGMSTVLVVPVPLDSQVIFDGNVVKDGGNAPWRSTEVEAGKPHTIIVRKAGYREQTYDWQPVAGAEKTITAQLVTATGTLSILVDQEGAVVTVDGKSMGKAPVTLRDIDTSQPLAVEVSKRGCFEPWAENVEFAPTESLKTLNVVLEETPDCGKTKTRPPKRGNRGGRRGGSTRGGSSKVTKTPTEVKPAGKGLLRLNTKPVWANVKIDGRSTGKRTPLINYELPAGKHTLVLEAADGRRKTVTIEIRPDQVTTEIVNLQ